MFQKDLFKDKTVLVTGGGTGIGYEIARQFLTLGAEVYIASRKPEKLENAVLKLKAFGTVKAFALDIRETASIGHLADMIEAQSGKLDILINNAGGQFPSPAEAITENGWKAVINTNLNGTWFVTQEMAKRFFFKQGYANNDLLKGKEKQGKWFASAKFRATQSKSRLADAELGNWLSYFQ